MWERVGDRTELQHIDPPTLLAITAFLSRSPGLLNRGPEGPASQGHVSQSSIFSSTATAQSGAWGPILLGAGFLYCILSPTDWISCALSYIIVQRPLFLSVSQIVLIQPVHGQGYILIFLDRMHLLLTQVHFLFWQPGRVRGQYTTYLSIISFFLLISYFPSFHSIEIDDQRLMYRVINR